MSSLIITIGVLLFLMENIVIYSNSVPYDVMLCRHPLSGMATNVWIAELVVGYNTMYFVFSIILVPLYIALVWRVRSNTTLLLDIVLLLLSILIGGVMLSL